MPALNRPFGLAPFRNLIATEHTAAVQRYRIPQADLVAYYIGDAVTQAAGADALGVPNVAKSASTSAYNGVIVGVENPTVGGVSIQGTVIDDTITSVPATKTRDYYVWVADDPATLFMIQDDGVTGATLVAASARLNSSLSIAAPALGYQLSATTLLSSSFLASAVLNTKLIGLAQIPSLPGNVPNSFGPFAVWVVKANQHVYAAASVGI
jgi:hypothetical protein